MIRDIVVYDHRILRLIPMGHGRETTLRLIAMRHGRERGRGRKRKKRSYIFYDVEYESLQGISSYRGKCFTM